MPLVVKWFEMVLLEFVQKKSAEWLAGLRVLYAGVVLFPTAPKTS
jgi:hypothetical protein